MSDEFPLGALVTWVVPFNDRWVEIHCVVAEMVQHLDGRWYYGLMGCTRSSSLPRAPIWPLLFLPVDDLNVSAVRRLA